MRLAASDGDEYVKVVMRWATLAIVGSCLLMACANREDRTSLTKVTARLGWHTNANSAGQIVALLKGFYRDEGLDVELRPGGLDVPSVRTVAAGDDDIGFANSPDLVIRARAAGAPLRIVAVVQQQSYHRFFVRAGSPIRTPNDWVDQRVGVKYGSPTYIQYQVLLRKLDIPRESINEVPVKHGVHLFATGELDVYPGGMTNEAISLESQGIIVTSFDPAEYGISSMGNVVFAKENTLSTRPEMVSAFVRATLKGWEWSLDEENEDAALRHLLEYEPDLDPEKERKALQLNRELVLGVAGDELPYLGRISRRKLSTILGYLRDFGVVDGHIKVEDVYRSEFLPPPWR